MKYLVTGGAGFIGSHLCEYLLDQGHTVHVVDNLSTGSLKNIDHLSDHPRFQITVDTVLNPFVMERMVQEADMVFHLAAAVGVKLIIEQPVATMETNLQGTETILKLAARHGKKVLITSTSEVYGKNNKLPFDEDDDCTYGPTTTGRWSYAYSKAIDEFMAFAYLQECNVPVIVTRLFNTVGPRQTGRYGMVIPRFIRQALHNESITVYGSGQQSRSFTFVGDVVKALVDLSECEDAVGKVFNVGNDERVSIEDLAQKIKLMTGSTSKIKYIPYEEAFANNYEDMMHRMPSLKKINKLIGYRPTMDLDSILRTVIDHTQRTMAHDSVEIQNDQALIS
ncbi:MAG: NAD-dependent epimerase/dehydratase family protein [bacterium]|nr:NAD-dependent epimerase/dehydratase family protein [bacterium]